MDKRLSGDEIVDNPSKEKRNSSGGNENSPSVDLEQEIDDNPLDAIIIAQLGELEGRLNSKFDALVTQIETCVSEVETRIEDRCRELNDRINLCMPPGSPEDQNRLMLQSMQLLQLESRRVTAELAELRRNPAPASASAPDVAALITAAVGEATRNLNEQVVALNSQLKALAEKKEPPPVPEPKEVVVQPEAVVKESPLRRRHRMI